MRFISGVFCVILVLFAAVQYNDPDALLWAAIYGIAAIWCGLVAFRPDIPAGPKGRALLGATLILAAIGVVWYWPTTPGFWHKEVWYNTEAAREGMGMMITFAGVLFAWFAARSRKLAA